ncbi:MAG TPA: ABC transporter substrate-binding protein [Myxococcota bacterium]|nr:ABC transporter substrate-binding protein [Myxococcales bacterium]HPG27922.1 ABC transporter substrate-binding protein [Myxococcota bacterium]
MQETSVDRRTGGFGRRGMRAFIALLALALLAFGTAAGAEEAAAIAPAAADAPAASGETTQAEADSPVPVIEAFHAGLLDIMKHAKELGFEGRIEKLAPLMSRTFDLGFMASKTVGRHWQELSPEDQKRWAETFARFTTANYAGRFTGFKGEQFVTLGVEDAARDTRVVLTKIEVPGDEDVQLNYRVLRVDGAWRVIDVYLNGTVSELALRRSEYSTALKREGFEQLVASVENKIADLKSKGRVDG